jgi:hypothetical protein
MASHSEENLNRIKTQSLSLPKDQLHASRKTLKMQGGDLADTSQRVTRRA